MGADHIGDVLYNTASLLHLKTGLPDCRWHCAADPPASEVLANNPNLEGVLSRNDLIEMPVGSFDAAICYNSGATWRDLLFAARLGIPNRVGYVDKGFSALVTFPIEAKYPQPYPAYFRDLVSQLTGLAPSWPLRPFIYPTEEDEREAVLFRDEFHAQDRPLIACFATSRQDAGVWPARDIAKVLRMIHDRIDCQSILFGAASDETLLASLKQDFFSHRFSRREDCGWARWLAFSDKPRP